MKYVLLLVVFVSVLSCTGSKKARKSKENIERLKQLGYCKCLQYSIEHFVGKDSIDNSYGSVTGKMDFFGGYFVRTSNMYPLLDSSAKSIFLAEERIRFSKGRAESAFGKTAYKLACLDYYNSKQLDSLARIINKRINDSIYTDAFYNK